MNGQELLVLNHLQANGCITSWDAIQKYRITRLSEYIRSLRSRGYDIDSEWRQGGSKRWVEYILKPVTIASVEKDYASQEIIVEPKGKDG